MQKRKISFFRSLYICFLSLICILCVDISTCKADTVNTLPDATLDEGGKSETISAEGNFVLDVMMHTEVTDVDYNCIYLEIPLEDCLLIVCFNNCDGNGQYRWWSDIKTPAGATLIQENCFKDVQANQDISNRDIQVKLCREWNKVTLQAYRTEGESQELFCDYELEVKGIPDTVNVYFGGENYKISNATWSVQELTKNTDEIAWWEESGIKASEAGTNNKLSDVLLDEGKKSDAIILEGDFVLDVTMHAEETDDYKNCIYLEMPLGEDILIICFSQRDWHDYEVWSDIKHPDDSVDKQQDCFEYVGTSQYISGEDIRIRFCRNGNTVTLQAERLGFFGGKTFCDYELELESIPETVGVYFGGEKMKISDINWNVGEMSETGMESLSDAQGVVAFVITLIVAIVLYLVTVKLIKPALEDAFYVDVPPVLDVLSALCLVYGGIMVTSWFNWPLAHKLVNAINRIYTLFELSLPSSKTLLGNKIFVIIVLVIGVGILVLRMISEETLSAAFVTLLLGVLKLAALFVVVPIALTSIAALAVAVVMCVIIGCFFGGAATAGSTDDERSKEPGFMDMLLNSSDTSNQNSMPSGQSETRVWRVNGMMHDNLKVSSDGERYFDPEDGEWHKIK